MRDLPVVFKMILNILLYIFYVLVASVLFSFIFPLILQLFGKEVLSPNDPVFAKIQIFIAFFVLVVSILLRKYFYISCSSKGTSATITSTKKDDTLKIQIEKEIK